METERQHPESINADTAATTCVVFAAGTYFDERPSIPQGAFVVAADGGLDHARALGIHADAVIGDFDSISGPVPEQSGTIRLPEEKDDPDLLSALKVGWAKGARTFHIYGALGGRVDHSIANIQILARLAAHGGIGYLFGDGTVVTAISDGSLAFPAEAATRGAGRMVSVFSHSDRSIDVTERGLKYRLDHATMLNDTVQGVSNEFLTATPAQISVGAGTLVVTFPAEAGLPHVTRRHPFSGDLGALSTAVSHALATPRQ
ncbi:thiamine diphosphokinase [Bifidobacterium thermophilum]|uniref:thiamine diphosphokinase n=1 Tax=Bifidobacterium thermophilum TaxID=33905 RepID=UPI0030ABFBCD